MPYISLVGNETVAGSPFVSDPTVSRILYCDPNWALTIGYATQDIYWRSRESGSGEAATGKIEVGYYKLKNKLTFPIAGGGNTNGNLKTLQIIKAEDNTILTTYTLNTLLSNTNSDILKVSTIDTSSWMNTVCLLRFLDSDTGGGWSWMGFDLSNIYCF